MVDSGVISDMEQNLVTVCETFVKMIENLEGSVNFLLVIVKIEAGPGRAGDPHFFISAWVQWWPPLNANPFWSAKVTRS